MNKLLIFILIAELIKIFLKIILIIIFKNKMKLINNFIKKQIINYKKFI